MTAGLASVEKMSRRHIKQAEEFQVVKWDLAACDKECPETVSGNMKALAKYQEVLPRGRVKTLFFPGQTEANNPN